MAITKKPSFTNLDEDTEKKIIKGAALSERRKSTAGRKPKNAEEKANAIIAVCVTNEEKETITNYCKDKKIPVSVLVKQLLEEKGIL